VILVPSLTQAIALVDRLAPEHLEIATGAPEKLAGLVRNAGAIFLGHHTPEAIGDYVGGPNHVLPTARTARFSSGLGVIDFMKRTTWLDATRAGLVALAPAAVALAEAEGLHAHARSVSARLHR
jgi:histidinol dehydrogenase